MNWNHLQTKESLWGFFSNVQNLEKPGGIVEDICDAMVDYQVHISSYLLPLYLTLILDFIATRYR